MKVKIKKINQGQLHTFKWADNFIYDLRKNQGKIVKLHNYKTKDICEKLHSFQLISDDHIKWNIGPYGRWTAMNMTDEQFNSIFTITKDIDELPKELFTL